MNSNNLDSSETELNQKDEEPEDPRLAQAHRLYQTAVMLIYGKRKSVDKAIKCIQRAITFDDSNYNYWQLLGEAYYQRGSLNPAINCFMKSLKLAEDTIVEDESDRRRRHADCTYSRLRMSDIRLSVGHLDEAANGYHDIVSNEPENVAALLGISRTKLQLARNSFSSGLVKLGHGLCMESLKYALRAIKLCPHLCLTWKLASDCCLIQFVYGQKGKFEHKIHEQFPGSEQGDLTIDRRTCIELAQQFICKALEIDLYQESGCLWHNLGISLYLKSGIVLNSKERVALLKRSIKCLLKALDCDRNSSQIKNSLGVVAFHLNLLNSAQNFIFKSIQTNLSTSEMQFSNIGYMYLQKGEFRLASTAFSRCQAEEPLYSRSWLGNALINEQSNLDNLSHLRHCQRLENNYESQLMFATKVASLPHTEEYDKDVTNALDCMNRIINYDNSSLEANNTLGLLYERCKHHERSRLCFNRAYNICSQDTRVIFNKLRQHKISKACYSIEADCLSTTEHDLLKRVESTINSGNKDYILNYIYYLFTNQDYKKVNAKMSNYMDKLPQEEIKNKISAQILLGLAAKAEGSDYKSWLFKNIIDSENVVCIEPVINLICLMLLGTLAEDKELVLQICKDLSSHLINYLSTSKTQFETLLKSPDGCWIRFAIFCSIFCQQDQCRLIKLLLALFPTIAEFWLYLGLALMLQTPVNQMASFCIKKANLIESNCPDLVVVCDIILSILPQAPKSKSDMRTKYLSRAIYKYPWILLPLSNSQKYQEKSKRSSDSFDSSLFQLAIDHIIRMIFSQVN